MRTVFLMSRALPPTRHRRHPSDSDADASPAPCTVTGAPPSAGTRGGDTALTAHAPAYVNHATGGDPAYCCPFIDTPTPRAPAEASGLAHSSSPSSTCRASTALDACASPKRQRSVHASANAPPAIETRVPPRSGPSGGANALDGSSSPW